MKIRSLLLAASAVAMSATAANAYDFTAAAIPGGAEGAVLSAELDLATTPQSGDYAFNVARAGSMAAFPSGAATVVITLPTGRFFDGDNTGATITTDQGAIGSRTAGGADGENSITFAITFGATDLNFDVSALTVNATADTGGDDVTISIVRLSDNAEVDTAADDFTAFPNGIFAESATNLEDAVVVADTTASTVQLPNLNSLADPLLGTVLFETNTVGEKDTAGTAFSNADVNMVSFTVNFPEGTDGLTSVDLVSGVTSTEVRTHLLFSGLVKMEHKVFCV